MTSRTWRTRTPRGRMSCEDAKDREARRGPPSPTTGSPGPISRLRPSSSPRSPPPRTRAPRWATWRRSSRKTTRTERRRRLTRPVPKISRSRSARKAKTKTKTIAGLEPRSPSLTWRALCSGTAARSRSSRTAWPRSTARGRPAPIRISRPTPPRTAIGSRRDGTSPTRSESSGTRTALWRAISRRRGGGTRRRPRRSRSRRSARTAPRGTTSAGWCTTGGVSACSSRSARRTAR